MATQIRLRRGLATEWTASNPTLANGELGFETDTKKFKQGDGLTPWNSLAYSIKSFAELEALYEPKNANIQSHIASTSNPHSTTKEQVGLGNVDNTSDASKPISSATQSALDLKASIAYVDAEVSAEAILRQDGDEAIMAIFNDTKEPTGHLDRTQSVMSFNESTRTLSIGPVSTSFTVYVKGTKLEITSTLTKQIPNTSGNYFFYINASGALDYFFSFNPLVLTDVAYTAFVHWNATIGQAVAFGEERHGTVMDGATHSYLHTTRGTQLVSGASITYALGDGSSVADSQIALANMQVKDEDITANIAHASSPSAEFQQVLNPIAYIPVHYLDGNEWVRATANSYPMLVGTDRAKYNAFNGSWSLVEATGNKKVLVSYIFATTNMSEPVIALLGQDQYDTLDDAKANGTWDKISFGDLPAQEMKLIYIVYYETSSQFNNASKSKIVYISDVRFNIDRQVSATVFNGAHGNLSGLENDDHPQYLDITRGDARYYTQAQSTANFEPKNANIQSHILSVANPHGVTKGQVGLGSVDNVSASDLRDRSTHTGSQLASTISDFTTAVQAVTIDASKIDGGSVSNEEFQTLNGITTGVSIQSQIDGKQPIGSYITALTGDVTASGPGSATATLANSGVVAGTYDKVTVNAKGLATSGTKYRFINSNTVAGTNTTITYANVTGLVSDSLPIGLYRFQFFGNMQSSNLNAGVGVRISSGTATLTTVSGKWNIAQGVNGTAHDFEYDQVASNTDVVSGSVTVANSNFAVNGFGVFRVTIAGTVAIQIRTETAGQTATLQPDAVLIVEALN